MLGENFKKTIIYRYLRELIEDISSGEEDIEYDIDKSIEQILGDDKLWDEFYTNLYADIVKKEE